MITACLPFYNESRYLPGWIDHILPYVDNIVALDDCSTDGSSKFFDGIKKAYLIDPVTSWASLHGNEVFNRRRLLDFANYIGSQWVLVCDADERYQTSFLENLRTITRTSSKNIIYLRMRDLWDSPDQYRVDGYWNTKCKAALLRSIPVELNRGWNLGSLHTPWFQPPQSRREDMENCPFFYYHLRSMKAVDRFARWEKYRLIDPTNKEQEASYEHLIDLNRIKLVKIKLSEDYRRCIEDETLTLD